MSDAGNLRVFFKNIWLGPQDKDLLLAELRRQVDAQRKELDGLKRGEWVAKALDAESDRDRWKSVAIHAASVGSDGCPVEDCYYCNLVAGAVNDYVRDSIRKAVRGE